MGTKHDQATAREIRRNRAKALPVLVPPRGQRTTGAVYEFVVTGENCAPRPRRMRWIWRVLALGYADAWGQFGKLHTETGAMYPKIRRAELRQWGA